MWKEQGMDVGVGLPNAVRGVDRAGIVDWARRAEAAGFSSLGTIDRIAFPNYESLISLAAAAAVTDRIRLVTDILIAPLRANTALLAKQAATIDQLSEGRLVLGLAPGGREDDFQVSGVDFASRGRIFDRQLDDLARFWKGDGGVGPSPAQGDRPALLIGGQSDNTFRRAARHADGWTMGGGSPDAFTQAVEKLRAAWQAEGRDGEPRTMALFYFSLGDRAEENAREKLGDYYAWLGDYTEQIVASAAKDADTVKQYLSAFEQAGADEVICFPASADPEQVDLLKSALG
jgi:alkanesulfonate monooxygenase SsuD/methylene tetrahydromethanopterin reductase-like flavin-dependent oxidoreductase (luciferase family)